MAPSVSTDQISIKDRLVTLKRTLRLQALAVAAAQVPKPFRTGAVVFSGIVGVLVIVSLAVSNVIAFQGYETYAMAKPVAMHRVIRQAEVTQFSNKVSNAFGIEDHVATEFADWILEASERQHLAPELLASLVITESSFRKDVRSNVGAIGPAQVRPDYWGKFCGANDLHDPEQNVYCGAQILSHMLERCEGDHACALAAYNVGPYAKRPTAANRYLAKIGRYLESLESEVLENL